MSKIITDEKRIDEILERGAVDVLVKKHLKEKMLSGKQLKIKMGIDPTGSFLHLGHAVILRKLKNFQELGHQVIFLIGDFTAKIGDPTGRSSERKPLTEEEIKDNMRNYKKQAGKILDMNRVSVRYNSEWLGELTLKDTIMLTSKITYAQMAQRKSFKNRIKKDIDLSIQEFLYPAMQGYDSVVLEADVELGGTDQKFNLLMGRHLQKRYDQSPQDIITCPLLVGLDGTEKMSKSLGNYIALTEESKTMYGKIMSIPDNLIVNYFELCTEISLTEIEKIMQVENPRDAKMRLAFEIVKIFHGEDEAKKAQDYFVNTFSKKEIPDEVTEFKTKVGENILDFLVACGGAISKGDARRKIEQNGVSIDKSKLSDINYKLSRNDNNKIVKVGKKFFVKIVF